MDRPQGILRTNGALYFALIIVTTVGYGDVRPTHNAGKYAAIRIALTGITRTGIIVAIALHAMETALVSRPNKLLNKTRDSL